MNSLSCVSQFNSMRRCLTLVFVICLLSCGQSLAAIEAIQFDDPTTEQRYRTLINELRCLVCQNQNLAESDAGLAKDLRRKTAKMLADGKTNKQILRFMRERYGDFVLYRPPFNLRTSLLWTAPFLLLLTVAVTLLLNIRRRQRNELLELTLPINENQRRKVRDLLEKPIDIQPEPSGPVDKP